MCVCVCMCVCMCVCERERECICVCVCGGRSWTRALLRCHPPSLHQWYDTTAGRQAGRQARTDTGRHRHRRRQAGTDARTHVVTLQYDAKMYVQNFMLTYQLLLEVPGGRLATSPALAVDQQRAAGQRILGGRLQLSHYNWIK